MSDADRGSGSGVWTATRRVVTVLLAVALVTATVPVGSVVGTNGSTTATNGSESISVTWGASTPETVSPEDPITVTLTGRSEGPGRVCVQVYPSRGHDARYFIERVCEDVDRGQFDVTLELPSAAELAGGGRENLLAQRYSRLRIRGKLRSDAGLVPDKTRTAAKYVQVKQPVVRPESFPYERELNLVLPANDANGKQKEWITVRVDRRPLPEPNAYRVTFAFENTGVDRPDLSYLGSGERLYGYPDSEVEIVQDTAQTKVTRVQSSANGESVLVDSLSAIETLTEPFTIAKSIVKKGVKATLKELLADEIKSTFTDPIKERLQEYVGLRGEQRVPPEWTEGTDDKRRMEFDFGSDPQSVVDRATNIRDLEQFEVTVDVRVTGDSDSSLVLLPNLKGGFGWPVPQSRDGGTVYRTEYQRQIVIPLPVRTAPPEPTFEPERDSVTVGETVELDASDTTDPVGRVTEYAWDFDDDGAFEETTASPTVTHEFTDAGRQTVRLRVTDSDGATAETTRTVTVTDPASDLPVASVSGPATGSSAVNYSPTLSWTASGDYEYRVYLGTSDDPGLYTQTTESSVEVTGLEPGETYHWQIGVVDGNAERRSPVWTFTTASQTSGLSLTDLSVGHQHDEPTIRAGMEEGHVEFEIASDGEADDYDVRVRDAERGYLVGTTTGSGDEEFGLDVQLEEQHLFREPGRREFVVTATHHATGQKVRKRVVATVESPDTGYYRDLIVTPFDPRVGETVTVSASHLEEDSSGAEVTGYDWRILHTPDEGIADVVLEESGTPTVRFTADEAGEYDVSVSNPGSGYIIPDGGGEEVYVEESAPEPDLRVGDLQVPSEAVAGESVEVSLKLQNHGDEEAHSLIRYRVDGTVVDADAFSVDPAEDGDPETDTEEDVMQLQAGTHTITAVVIDPYGQRKTVSKQITVSEPEPERPPRLVEHDSSDGPVTLGETVRYEATVKDPNGDTVPLTLQVSPAGSGDWETVTESQVTGTGSVTWQATPERAVAEGNRTEYRLVTGSQTFGPFDGPEVVDDDTTGPTISDWSYSGVVRPQESVAVTVSVADERSGLSRVRLLYDGPTGEGSLTMSGSDSGKYTGRVPADAVSAPGELRIVVTATDNDETPESTRSGSRSVTVDANEPPVASVSVETEAPTVGESVTLSAVNTTDPDQNIVTYRWDTDGDGEFEQTAGETLTLTPTESGTRTVRLQVVDGEGERDTAGVTFEVDAADTPTPTARLTAPQTATVGETVTFDATGSADPEASGLEYEFDVDGDGAYERTTDGRLSVTVDSPGDRTVGVRVTDASGDTDTATATVTVEPPTNTAPTASLSVSETATVDRAVTLDAAGSTDPDGEIVEYRFDTDGDGRPEETTDRPTTTVTYDEAGTYTPRVTVVDDDGTTRTATATVAVEPVTEAPTATRDLPDGVQPGERVTVSVRVPVDGEVNGLAVDEESPLAVVDQQTTPQAEYRSDERQWLFVSVTDRTAVVNYTVQVPDDAEPGARYTFDGEVSGADTSVGAVGGDTTLVVRRCPASAVAGDDNRIDLREIQRAVGAWADDEPVAGEVLDLQTIQRLIGLWVDSERATCAG